MSRLNEQWKSTLKAAKLSHLNARSPQPGCCYFADKEKETCRPPGRRKAGEKSNEQSNGPATITRIQWRTTSFMKILLQHDYRAKDLA